MHIKCRCAEAFAIFRRHAICEPFSSHFCLWTTPEVLCAGHKTGRCFPFYRHKRSFAKCRFTPSIGGFTHELPRRFSNLRKHGSLLMQVYPINNLFHPRIKQGPLFFFCFRDAFFLRKVGHSPPNIWYLPQNLQHIQLNDILINRCFRRKKEKKYNCRRGQSFEYQLRGCANISMLVYSENTAFSIVSGPWAQYFPFFFFVCNRMIINGNLINSVYFLTNK